MSATTILRKVELDYHQYLEVGDYFNCRVKLSVIHRPNAEAFCFEFVLIEDTTLETSKAKVQDSTETVYYDIHEALSEYRKRANSFIEANYKLY